MSGDFTALTSLAGSNPLSTVFLYQRPYIAVSQYTGGSLCAGVTQVVKPVKHHMTKRRGQVRTRIAI